MSFDKAVIKRFNEESTCAPPPTKYDPKLPHGYCAKDINFGHYSGRKEPCKMKDGFLTPAKPTRGRPLIPGSASARSWSDSRLRNKGTHSVSTKSLNEIPSIQSLANELDEKHQEILNLQPTNESEQTNGKEEIRAVEKILADLQASNGELQQQNSSLADEVQRLKTKADIDACDIEALNGKLLKEQETFIEFQTLSEMEKKRLASENDEIKREISQVTSSYEKLNEQVNTLKLQSEILQDEISLLTHRFENECKQKDETILNLQSEITRLQVDREKLYNDLMEAQLSLNELSTTKSELEEKQQEIIHLQMTIESERTYRKEEIQALEKQLADLHAACGELQQQNASFAGEVQRLNTKTDEDACNIQLLNDKLHKEQEAFVEFQAFAEMEKKKLTFENEEIKLEIAQVTSSYKTLDEQFNTQKLQNEILQDEISLLTHRFENEHKQKDEINHNLHSEIKRLQADREKLNNDLSEAQMSLTELSTMKSELEEKHKEIAHLQTTIDLERTNRKEEIQASEKQLADLQAACDELQQQYLSLADEVQLLKTKADKDACDIELLNGKLRKEQEAFIEFQTLSEMEKKELASENEEIKREIAQVTSSYKTVDEQFRNHKLQYEILQEEISLLTTRFENECKQKDEINLNLQSEITRLQADREKLYNDLMEAQLSLNELSTAKSELEEKHREIIHLQTTIESERIYRKEEIQATEKQLADLQVANGELQQQNSSLADEVQRLKTKADKDACDIESLNGELRKERETFIEFQTLSEMEKKKLASDNDEIKHEIAQLTSSYEKLNEQLNTHKLQNEVLEENISLLTTRFENECKQKEEINLNLQSEIERLQADREKLYNDLSEAQLSLNELSAMKSELEEKQLEIMHLQTTIDSERTNRKEEIQAAEKILADLQAANGELQQQYLSLDDEVQRLKAKAYEDAQDIQSLNDKLLKEKEIFVEFQTFSETEKNRLTSENEEMKREIAQVTSLYQTVDDQFRTHQLRNEILEENISLLTTRFENEHKQKDEINHNLQSEIKRLQADREKLNNDLSKTQLSLNELSTAKSENAILKDRIQNAVHQYERDQETIKSLNEILQRYKEQEEEISRQDSERESLLTEIQALKLQNSVLNENLEKYKNVFGDYANLASHQNNRQKIKHIVNMKEELIKLRDENSILRQKYSELKEKSRQAPPSNTSRRFDPSQAFKPILKEPFIRDERDVRGPDARSTFTVPKKANPKPVITVVDSTKKESKQGLAFDITFSANKEN